MRVLIVEDEIRLARNAAKALTEIASFAVDISTDGEDGQHQAQSSPYDLIILDLMLPRIGYVFWGQHTQMSAQSRAGLLGVWFLGLGRGVWMGAFGRNGFSAIGSV